MGWRSFVGPAITCIIAVLKVVYDLKKDSKLTWYSWVLIIGAIVYFGFECFNMNMDSANAAERQAEMIEAAKGVKDGLKNEVDTATKKIDDQSNLNRDSIIKAQKKYTDSLAEVLKEKDSRPLIDIYPNPYLSKSDTLNSYRVNMKIVNYGGYANKFIVYTMYVLENNGLLNSLPKSKVYHVDESKFLINNGIYLEIKGRAQLGMQAYYIVIFISYSDRGGKKYPPVHKIFAYPGNMFDQPIPEANSKDYERVKDILIKNRDW